MHILDVDEEERAYRVQQCRETGIAWGQIGGAELSAKVEEMFSSCEMIWTAWPQPGQPAGHRVALVKGWGLLTLLSQHSRGKDVRVGHMPILPEEAAAEAVSEVYGDNRAIAAAREERKAGKLARRAARAASAMKGAKGSRTSRQGPS